MSYDQGKTHQTQIYEVSIMGNLVLYDEYLHFF